MMIKITNIIKSNIGQEKLFNIFLVVDNVNEYESKAKIEVVKIGNEEVHVTKLDGSLWQIIEFDQEIAMQMTKVIQSLDSDINLEFPIFLEPQVSK